MVRRWLVASLRALDQTRRVPLQIQQLDDDLFIFHEFAEPINSDDALICIWHM